MSTAPQRMNDSGTCTSARAKSVQPCSLIVLARQVAKRPDLTPQAQRLASLLLQQTYSYDANPEADATADPGDD